VYYVINIKEKEILVAVKLCVGAGRFLSTLAVAAMRRGAWTKVVAFHTNTHQKLGVFVFMYVLEGACEPRRNR
jgi:hypothetical protein